MPMLHADAVFLCSLVGFARTSLRDALLDTKHGTRLASDHLKMKDIQQTLHSVSTTQRADRHHERVSGAAPGPSTVRKNIRMSTRKSRFARPVDPNKPFLCPSCGATYFHRGSLGSHRRKCEGTLRLHCSFCSHVFHRKDKLRDHLLRKHKYVDKELGPPGYTLPKFTLDSS
ncbi:hypothetical protein BaRGS_00027498 [Batillaria attramentaria]|uniref:C2H2-type domain-containing protein n=1 Tax=Batillaria attramentaria TaxID=370345 RepID=A0ABD0K2N9_9CAEN